MSDKEWWHLGEDNKLEANEELQYYDNNDRLLVKHNNEQ